MQKYGQEEIDNLTKVIQSNDFADHAGGFMDQLRQDLPRRTAPGTPSPPLPPCS